jgi:hypothetical protein
MDIKEIVDLYEEYSSKSEVFKDNEYVHRDSVVTNEVIASIEKDLKLKLPKSYIDFCKNLGGGYFGYAIIFSLDREGDFFLLKMLEELKNYIPFNALPISDDQTGGFYCFLIGDDSVVSENLCYVDESGNAENMNLSFFEMIRKRAFHL